jgi:VTC domain
MNPAISLDKAPFADALSALDPVSLKGLDKVKLMNRVDSKYVFHVRELSDILQEIAPHYAVLEIEGKRLFDYVSLYFDTESYLLYRQHHMGKPNRVKLRFRQYVDTGDVFFEVKKKIKGARTDKHRVRLSEINKTLSQEAKTLMQKLEVDDTDMVGKTWINYKRITLAAHASEERVTLDLSMEFIDENGNIQFPELVIAEIKQARMSRQSPIITTLQAHLISPLRVSKYSLAVAMLVPGIKSNAFKSKINQVNKIINA